MKENKNRIKINEMRNTFILKYREYFKYLKLFRIIYHNKMQFFLYITEEAILKVKSDRNVLCVNIIRKAHTILPSRK